MGKLSRKEVLERFEEAVYTAKRLPPVIIPGCKAAWPDIIYTPLEILQQEKRPIKLRPSSEQLSRLDEVLSWTPLLTELERKLIWYKAQRKPWKTTFNSIYSAVNKGIADVQTETQNQIATLQQPETHRLIARKQPPPNKYS